MDEAALEANFASVKGAIRVEEVAGLETCLRRTGAHLKGLCPLPGHDEKSPSFVCYPDQGTWWCFGCDSGGDVIDLWQAQQGPFGNLVMAMEDLAEHFGLSLWRPEDLMSESQIAARKARRRVEAAFDRALRAHYFELWVMPTVNAVEDLGEREALLERSLKEAGLTR